MNSTSTQNLTGWSALPHDGTKGTAASCPIRKLKRQQMRKDLRRLMGGVAFSLVVHASLFIFSGHKEEKPAVAAPPRPLALEKFTVPLDLEPEVVEEPTELPDVAPAADFAPPMQAELVSVAIDSEFTMMPAPPMDSITKVDATMIRIPEHAARGGVGGQLKEVFNLGELDRPPVLSMRTAPEYPVPLQSSMLEGTVVVRFVVDEQGNVRDIFVVSSTHEEFTKSVLKAVPRWRFKPGMVAGKFVSVRLELPIGFAMDK